jgi:aminoglycoside 2'-N-acetyltransferase I
MVQRRPSGVRNAKAKVAPSGEVRIEIWPTSRWNEVAPIVKLVYPPSNPITKVWNQVDWSYAQRRVVVLGGTKPVCHVGVYFRDGKANGRDAAICGIGGVMTHPKHQGRHHATRALERANEMALKRGMKFGLLVCEEKNIALYRKFGWRVFPGQMIYRRGGEKAVWELSPVMVRDIAGKAPTKGKIDLCGKPW